MRYFIILKLRLFAIPESYKKSYLIFPKVWLEKELLSGFVEVVIYEKIQKNKIYFCLYLSELSYFSKPMIII